MARTPLMQALQRMASEHAEADERGISIEEVRHERQLRLSRRDLLKGAGALAAGIAFTDPLNLAGRFMKADAASQPRIGIVGAGIAGLNAALTLQDAGYASTVFEASSRVGGRMHSNTTTWANGQTSEWCGELIDSDHVVILGLAKRFGLRVVDLIAAQPKGSQDTYFFFGKYYLQKDADQDFRPVYNVLQQQLKLAPFPTLYDHYTDFGYKLDHTSLYEWIEQYVPGGHRSNMGQLLDVAYNEEYGRETYEQSSLNLVYLLGFQPTAHSFSIFGTSDERYHVFGGNEQIPIAIANSLPADSVKLNWKMTAIATNSDKTITLTFSTPNGTQQQTFERVILAIPFSVLRTLDYSKAGFDNLKKIAIKRLGYGTNSKLQLQFDSRYWNGTGAWPGISDGNIYTDIGFQNTWDVTRAQPGKTGIIVDYTGGNKGASYQPNGPYTATPDARVEHYANVFVKQLEEVWPGATQHYIGIATLSYPTGDPNLLGSYSCWLLGQYTLFSGYERAPQGYTFFAGEHCSINFQGFMEGGAEEGARAANQVLKSL